MNEYEALMIDESGTCMVVSAWGASLEDASQRAGKVVSDDFPGWTVILSGDLR